MSMARESFMLVSWSHELNYKHGIELLTGFFSLLGDKEVLKYTVDYLQKHTDTLKRNLDNYIQEHGVVPRPGVLLSEFNEAMGVTKRPAAAMGVIKRPAFHPLLSLSFSSSPSPFLPCLTHTLLPNPYSHLLLSQSLLPMI